MTPDKVYAFLAKTISDTKDEKISWVNVHDNLDFPSYKAEKSYIATTKYLKLYLLCSRSDDSFEFFVQNTLAPVRDKTPIYECRTDKIDSLLQRLYNVISSQVPNIETLIDKYLEDDM